LVETGNVDVVHVGLGLTGPSHTGTNGVDLNGQTGGSIFTNRATTVGKTYLLSFAFCKNPDGITPPSVTAAVSAGTQSMNFTYSLPNSYANPNWLTTSIVVRASSNITPLRFSSVSPSGGSAGMFIDTIRMDEVDVRTNAVLYATFTDDPLKAFLPIKFAPPPFGDTNFNGTNLFISGFEGTAAGVYTNGQQFIGWKVRTNSVYVQSNNVAAYSDTNYLLLRTGIVTRVLPTVAGKEYVLQFATRSSRSLIYNTGVDEDGLPLPGGSIDPHYFVGSNSFSRATNAAYVLQTNSAAFATSWINRNLPESRWIGIHPAQPAQSSNIFGFKTQFDLTGYNWQKVSLTGRYQVDGPTTAVLLNGANIAYALISGAQQSYSTGFVTRTITNGFVSGINTLEFVLTNRFTANGFDPSGFQAQFDANAIQGTNLPGVLPPILQAVGQIRLAGSYTNYFSALSDLWRVENVTFVARSNNMELEFAGITPGVWLDHIQLRETGRKYYLPEEPFTPLVGDQAFGPWKLEVWDSRLGAMLGNTDLISWRLNLTYVRTNPPLGRLTNGVVYVGTVFTNNLQYFMVNVPCDAAAVTNTLTSLTPPGKLDLLFNQDAYPTGSEPGDVMLMSNVASNSVVLNVGYYPLARKGAYLLAVRNTNPAEVNDFTLQVDIGCPPAVAPSPFIVPSQVSFGPSGFTLKWFADPSEQFSVQYTDDLNGPWNAIPASVVSDTGEFSFTDDGTVTGGLPTHRFYRLLQQ
jgi:hypothetical protein